MDVDGPLGFADVEDPCAACGVRVTWNIWVALRDRRVKGGALQLNSAAHVNAQALAGSQQAVAHGLRASGDGVEPSLDLAGHKPQRVKKRRRPRRAVAAQHGLSGSGVVVAAAVKLSVRQVAPTVARGQNGQTAGHVAFEHADGGTRAARGYGGGKAGGPSTNDGNVVAGLRAGVHGFSLSGSGRVVRPGAGGRGWARLGAGACFWTRIL